MYYIFASLVVGVFIGGSTLVSQPNHAHHATASYDTAPQAQQDAGPIVNNQALSAETTLSLGL